MKKILFLIQALLMVVVSSFATGEDDPPEETASALDIRIHSADEQKLTPPAELLLIDSKDRKTGKDPRTNKLHDEIPHSSYENESIDDDITGAPGPETKIIYVRNPAVGEYQLQVIGTEQGRYHLEVRGYDCELNSSDAKFLSVEISGGAVHEYLLRYSNAKGSKIEVRQTV